MNCKGRVKNSYLWHAVPCSRPAKDGMDGYCAIHYPPNVAAREKARQEKWKDAREKRESEWAETRRRAEASRAAQKAMRELVDSVLSDTHLDLFKLGEIAGRAKRLLEESEK